METAADNAALDTLEKYYGHLTGAEAFFEKILSKHHQASWQTIFASHPNIQQRIAQIKSRKQNTAAKDTKTLDPRLNYLNL
jgi:Zn-dependent protease with chaperone function